MNQNTRSRTISRAGAFVGIAAAGLATSTFAAPIAHAAPALPQRVASMSASCFSIPAPAKPGDLAVINVITTDALGNGYTTARPYGSTPTPELPSAERTSTGNFLGNSDAKLRSTDPNMAIVEIGTIDADSAEGAVCVDTTVGAVTAGSPAANLVVDYLGYMPADGGAHALDKQTRLVDTRLTKTPVKSDEVLWIDSVDAEENDAVFVNALIPFPKAPGYGLVLGENDTPNSKVTEPRSVLNFAVNTEPFNVNANPNTAMAVVGANHKIGVEPHSSDGSAVDVVVDELAVIDADKVLAVDPVRVYDARTADAAKDGKSICFGLPSIGEGMTAVVNLTVDTRPEFTGTDSFGWVYIRPSEAKTGQESNSSTANFKPFNGRGNIDPNTTMVTVGASKEVCVDGVNGTGKPIYFIVDLLGAFENGTFIDAATTTGGRKRLVDTRDSLLLPNLSPPIKGTIEILVDADGNGADELSEYVKLTNTAKGPINLTGWTIKDAATTNPHEYEFGKTSSFVLAAGASVTLHTGKGTDTATDLYWGLGNAVWNNTGDTVYLRDAMGTLVEEYKYPAS